MIAHQPMGALVGITAGTLAGIPLKIYSTGGLKYFPENKSIFNYFTKLGESIILSLSDAVFLVNRADENYLLSTGKFRQKSFYVGPLGGCGIDTSQFNGEYLKKHREKARKELNIPSNVQVIGYAGRCVWEKGFKEIIDAALILGKHYPVSPPLFLIIGEGQQREEIIEYANTKGVAHLFQFIDYKFNIKDYLSAFDIAILPSYREGLPVFLVEAMAMGLPCIASAIRGCNELISNGLNGMLIPVKNSDNLAETIKFLIDNPENRLRLGQSAADSIKNTYSEAILLPKTVEIIKSLAAIRTQEI